MDKATDIELDFEKALVRLDRKLTRKVFDDSGLSPLQFSDQIIVPVLDRLGHKWENGSLALSQIYMSGRFCEDLLKEILPPQTARETSASSLAVVVFEDHHFLGKRLLCSILTAAGHGYLDYGHKGLEELVTRIREDGIRILLVSTLMLPSALRLRDLRGRLDSLGVTVRIIVGGAPFRFDSNLWKEVGADATSTTVSGVLAHVDRYLGEIAHA